MRVIESQHLVPEGVYLLRAVGAYFLERGLSKLPKEGRPLSQKSNLETMYEARLPQYRRFADRVIDNDRESPDYAVEAILRDLEGKA